MTRLHKLSQTPLVFGPKRAHARLQHDECARHSAKHRVVHADHHAVAQRRAGQFSVKQQTILDLLCADAIPTHVDDFI